jgi:hypothetical protein
MRRLSSPSGLIGRTIGLTGALALSACAVAPPAGPSVMALPGQGKSFEAFQQDDAACRYYAGAVTGGANPAQAANNAAVGSAVVGTALGAAAGAAIGAAGGAAGAGAAIGGATGLVAGSAVGASNAYGAAGYVQQRYDVSYTQCMYSRGDSVQSPPGGYPYPAYAYNYGYPYYPYPYGYPYGPTYYGPSVAIGVGGGWGWGGGGWGGWHGGYGGGWHGYR